MSFNSFVGAARAAVPAAALALGLSFAGSAGAATYVIDRGDMPIYRILDLQGVGGVLAGPILFDGTRDGVAFTDLLAFCVDVYHHIGLGDYTPDLVYTDTVDLTFDSNSGGILNHFSGPTGLSAGDLTRIGQIVNFGTIAFHDGGISGDERADRVAAAQGAIWEVVSGRQVTGAGLDGRIDQYALGNFGAYGALSAKYDLITPLSYPSVSGTQSFAFAIPEPATWLTMLIGFTFTGAVVRRRKAVAA